MPPIEMAHNPETKWIAADGTNIKSESQHSAAPFDMAAFLMAQQQFGYNPATSFHSDAMAVENHHQQQQQSQQQPQPTWHQFQQQSQQHQSQPHFGHPSSSHHHHHHHRLPPYANNPNQSHDFQSHESQSLFNPLTPPGYSSAVMLAAVHQKLHEHQHQQQQQQLMQLQQSQQQRQQHHQQQQKQQHQHQSPQSPNTHLPNTTGDNVCTNPSTPFQSQASPNPLILTPNTTPPMIADETMGNSITRSLSPQRKSAHESQPPTAIPTTSSPVCTKTEPSTDATSHSPPQQLPPPPATISDQPPGSPSSCTSAHSSQAAKQAAVRQYEDSIYKPHYNAKGDPKQCKCKQCDFVSYIKADLWSHSVQHMNPEKILRCPQCPFVTEYKHHYDFHQCNHTGEKPFRCRQCAYTCVNNSMLKSHMKSHSDVHQYRCADCPYTSKYCHSMKLHLRNKQHQPAIELGLDGQPKGAGFIDVYGSRRGPKAVRKLGMLTPTGTPRKPRRSTKAAKCESTAEGSNHSGALASAMAVANVVATPYGVMKPMQNVPIEQQQQQFIRQCLHFKQLQLLHNEQQLEDEQEQSMRHMLLLLAKFNAQAPAGLAMLPATSEPAMSEGGNESEDEDEDDDGEQYDDEDDRLSNDGDCMDGGLDLSVPHPVAGGDQHIGGALRAAHTTTFSETPKMSVSHRRKGRAFKLNSASESEQQHDDMDVLDRLQTPPMSAVKAELGASVKSTSAGSTTTATSTTTTTTTTVTTPPSPLTYVAECRPCGIQYSDPVLHRLHMAYHGFNDPFTCNVCGSKCSDRVMFHMHIATQAH